MSRGTSLDQVLASVFAFGPATKVDLLTGAVAARADGTVYEALLRLPDGIYRSAAEVDDQLDRGPAELAS